MKKNLKFAPVGRVALEILRQPAFETDPAKLYEQAAKQPITDLSTHLATSRVLDPLQCPVLSLGEGDATALQSKQ